VHLPQPWRDYGCVSLLVMGRLALRCAAHIVMACMGVRANDVACLKHARCMTSCKAEVLLNVSQKDDNLETLRNAVGRMQV
jgi:hypothetical protein